MKRKRSPKPVASKIFSQRRLIFMAIAVVLVVTVIGIFSDQLLLRDGVTRFEVRVISNLLAGMACGGLVYKLLRDESDRRERLNRRLELIAEMNHHIRNALQVITFSVFDPRGRELSMDKIRQAVDRIQWALKEVLPLYSDHSSQTQLPDRLEQAKPSDPEHPEPDHAELTRPSAS